MPMMAACVFSPVPQVRHCLDGLIDRAAFILSAYLDEVAVSGRQVDRSLEHGALDSECYTKNPVTL